MQPTNWLLIIQLYPLLRNWVIKTFMSSVNKDGVKILPCLTPHFTIKYWEITPLLYAYQFTSINTIQVDTPAASNDLNSTNDLQRQMLYLCRVRLQKQYYL